MTRPLLRFAPSPTGYLHVGNARIALMNAILAQKLGGELMLRIDDTDLERSSEEYTQAIRDDLRWLGLEWQREERQSERLQKYDDALKQLVEAGRAYPCYDTPEELALMRKTALGAGRPPIYDRSALRYSEAQMATFAAEGRTPHWRFRLDHDKEIVWHDLARGEVRFEAQNLSDPVLFRGDGRALYTITSVVDDALMGISHILRGEDHVSNTATQIQLFEALGSDVPQFAHFPLLMGNDGKPLSKRWDSSSVRGLRDVIGYEPEAVASFLIALGTSTAAEPITSIADAVSGFALENYGKASPRFDEESLVHLNSRLLMHLGHDHFCVRLLEMGVPEEKLLEFWQTVGENLRFLHEAADWWQIIVDQPEEILMAAEDEEFCRSIADTLSDEVEQQQGYQAWIDAVKVHSGRKGKALFMPIRQSLTGRSGGPELHRLIALMGADEAKRRLQRR